MPDLLRRDPTRTTLIRRQMVADTRKRFKDISKEVEELVVNDDVFGLTASLMTFLQEFQAWRFRTNPEKVRAYRLWLQQQIDAGILTVDAVGKPWTATYVESAYKKGMVRAYVDARAKDLGTSREFAAGARSEFLLTSFAAPEVLSKIELLYTRTFEEYRGVTASMSQQMSRVLAEGLAQGRNPRAIARSLKEIIPKLSKRRAEVVARTEIIRAHAEGQLDSFERLNIRKVKIFAEWGTAGDDRVCPQCLPLEGQIFTIKEARGLIPRHPNCRCGWLPVRLSDRRIKGQKKRTSKAVKKSIQSEKPGATFKEAKRTSEWFGKEKV